MVTEHEIWSAIASSDISLVEHSERNDFITPKCDIFVWRRPSDGHTDIVTGVSADKKTIYVLESIGSSGGREEDTFNKQQGVDKVRNCQYKVGSKALSRHKDFKGYHRLKL
ncbi:hypothetical protein [Flavicella marina]|uniref:hypothetical protein n=1 Tax=Flavicella marina TaxID=1475951 RepID=UPI0012644A07|nr:hypothetical protein [Flavicella marina]